MKKSLPHLTLNEELNEFKRITGFTLHCVYLSFIETTFLFFPLFRNHFFKTLIEKHISIIQRQSSPDLLIVVTPITFQIDIFYDKKLKNHFTHYELQNCLEKIRLYFFSTQKENAFKLSIQALLGLF